MISKWSFTAISTSTDTYAGQASKKQSPEESGNREGSPSSPVVIKSDSGEEETPGRVNRQHDPSIASDLANKLFGERKTAKQERKSRAAQDRTNAGVKKTRAKKDARRKSKELVYFYVIFEYGVAIKVCKGWPAASRHVVGHRGRYSQRFDTREAAEDAMNNADDSSDSSDDE